MRLRYWKRSRSEGVRQVVCAGCTHKPVGWPKQAREAFRSPGTGRGRRGARGGVGSIWEAGAGGGIGRRKETWGRGKRGRGRTNVSRETFRELETAGSKHRSQVPGCETWQAAAGRRRGAERERCCGSRGDWAQVEGASWDQGAPLKTRERRGEGREKLGPLPGEARGRARGGSGRGGLTWLR